MPMLQVGRMAKLFLTAALGSIVISAMTWAPPDLIAQTSDSVALSGIVSSQAEGLMEGVVVSARRDGANFTVSVVSDAKGNYSFPRSHVEPGKYALTIRAAGYDLNGPGSVEIAAGKTANANLKLEKTKDLAAQLSSLEWAMSVPGTPEQKDKVIYQTVSCAYCHTWQRVMRSNHTAGEFVELITRMQKYYTDGSAVSTDKRGRGQLGPPNQVAAADQNPIWGREPYGVPKKELAEYLATVNLSGGRTTWPFELKTLPRPKGKATRVIITQYDMPRPDTVAHDLDLDSSGTVWYTDESRMFFGKMNPKTGKFTEYALPPVPPGDLPGARDIQVDREDNIWFPRRIANAGVVLTKFNPKTEEVSTIEGVGTQFMALGPEGKIWAGWSRIDPKTMKVEATYGWEKSPNIPPARTANTSISLWSTPREIHTRRISAARTLSALTPRPARPSSGRSQRQDHLRAAVEWMRRTVFGLPNIPGTRSACSTHARKSSRNGLCCASTRPRMPSRPLIETATCMRRATCPNASSALIQRPAKLSNIRYQLNSIRRRSPTISRPAA